MRIIAEPSAEIAGWVMSNLGQTLSPPYWALGVAQGDALRGGIVFNGWNGANIDITIFGPGAMHKSIIRGVFAYAFLGLGVTRITARTRISNSLMRGMLRRIGFEAECELPFYYGQKWNDCALQFRMMRRACRWIEHDGRTQGPRSKDDGSRSRRDEQRDGHRAGQSQQRQSGDAARQSHL